LYRARPSPAHTPLTRTESGLVDTDDSNSVIDPNQLRWKPFDIPTEETDFVQGLKTIAHAGKYTTAHHHAQVPSFRQCAHSMNGAHAISLAQKQMLIFQQVILLFAMV
jgi:homogentisate 1,2-dioxygenase